MRREHTHGRPCYETWNTRAEFNTRDCVPVENKRKRACHICEQTRTAAVGSNTVAHTHTTFNTIMCIVRSLCLRFQHMALIRREEDVERGRKKEKSVWDL